MDLGAYSQINKKGNKMNNRKYQILKKLGQLAGRRFVYLNQLKDKIEKITYEEVNAIIESESERIPEINFMIVDLKKGTEVYTIHYLKDNGGRYYITEV